MTECLDKVGQSYRVRVRRASDGVERVWPSNTPWSEGAEFFWSDGNGGCDCNRAQFFAEAAGEPDPNLPCGDGAFVVVAYEFEDGSVVAVDEA